MIQSGTGEAADDLLSILKTEIWPLLKDRSPIAKAEREQMLDDPTRIETAVIESTAEAASPVRPGRLPNSRARGADDDVPLIVVQSCIVATTV